MNVGGVPNTCKSNGKPAFGRTESGARVRNTWLTCPGDGDNRWKRRLIPDNTADGGPEAVKGVLRHLPWEGTAAHQLDGTVRAYHGEDG